jgi:tetratricopeptide (TPR) repeat protein
MSRLFNREVLAVVILGFVAVALVGWLAELGRIVIFFVAAWLVACLPIAMKVQHALIPLYLQLGFHGRALDLAVQIRESAPNRKLKDYAAVDVAMVQAALGRFEDGLRNLEGIRDEAFGDLPRALVVANRAWCRAHLGRDLDRALEEAREARKRAPNEGLITYFEGLVLQRLGRNEEAKKLIEASLEAEKDPGLPVPGERSLVLGDALAALGDADGARDRWKQAARSAKKKSPFYATIRERLEGTAASARTGSGE